MACGTVGCLAPTWIRTSFADAVPLRDATAKVRTIAAVLPSTAETAVDWTDTSRGKLDKVVLDLLEHLRVSGRFSIVPQDQFEAALSRVAGHPNTRPGSGVSDADRTALLLKAGALVEADAILSVRGKWESGLSLGESLPGQPELTRRFEIMLLGTGRGRPIWRQEVVAVIDEGMILPQESTVRRVVVSRLADHLLDTLP
jgi:hypothetical protein